MKTALGFYEDDEDPREVARIFLTASSSGVTARPLASATNCEVTMTPVTVLVGDLNTNSAFVTTPLTWTWTAP